MERTASIQKITPEQLPALLERGGEFILIDTLPKAKEGIRSQGTWGTLLEKGSPCE